jgi:hypothetical protein
MNFLLEIYLYYIVEKRASILCTSSEERKKPSTLPGKKNSAYTAPKPAPPPSPGTLAAAGSIKATATAFFSRKAGNLL